MLLPVAGIPIIQRLLAALDQSQLMTPYVIVSGQESEGLTQLRDRVQLVSASAEKPDLRSSVLQALEAIGRDHNPNGDDGWLLVTADHPVFDKNLVAAMLHHWNQTTPEILVPRYKQRRGHPVIYRWSFANQISRIPAGRGLNWLFRQYAAQVTEFTWEDDSPITDLNTEEDYSRLQIQWQDSRAG